MIILLFFFYYFNIIFFYILNIFFLPPIYSGMIINANPIILVAIVINNAKTGIEYFAFS